MAAVLVEGVQCSDVLPMAWQACALPLHPVEAERVRDDNVRLLRAAAVLEEYAETPEDAAGEGQEYKRLNDKLNIMLEMMGHILALHGDPPPPVLVTLSGSAIEWEATPGSAPAHGQPVMVSLHLHPHVPRPVRLAGQARCTALGDGLVHVSVRFEPLGEPLSQALERHVFRRHRRAVAGARRPGG